MSILAAIDAHIRSELDKYLLEIEDRLDADVLTIVGPIHYALDANVRRVIELFKARRARIAVILDTVGGIAEVVERVVNCIRRHYKEVYFVIPDRAMSAGTILAMSGDKIFMSYFSVLGPIDPQIEKEGKLVPALSYLNQYDRLCRKAEAGSLNTAEYALLQKLDLGELHQFEQARELSIELLEKWLSKYKFQDWETHKSDGRKVTDGDKRARAKEIGQLLSDTERWKSHGRGIPRDILTTEIRLRIDDLDSDEKLLKAVNQYFSLLKDYIERQRLPAFVHTREFF